MQAHRFFATVVCSVIVLSNVSYADLTKEEFHRVHEALRPKRDAVWQSIPWQIDLLSAQRQAAQERKPLFIWAMDGHPLGCT